MSLIYKGIITGLDAGVRVRDHPPEHQQHQVYVGSLQIEWQVPQSGMVNNIRNSFHTYGSLPDF